MKKSPIAVQASIAAPLQKVWDYWTGPEHVTQWNQASDDWHCLKPPYPPQGKDASLP